MPCARPGMPGIPHQQRLGTAAKNPAPEERGLPCPLPASHTGEAACDQVAILGPVSIWRGGCDQPVATTGPSWPLETRQPPPHGAQDPSTSAGQHPPAGVGRGGPRTPGLLHVPPPHRQVWGWATHRRSAEHMERERRRRHFIII